MDPNKWRIKKVGRAWVLLPPAGYPIQARGSWGYCITRLIQLQRAGVFGASTRWRDG